MAQDLPIGALRATINYFSSDPKFDREKPYVTSFPVDDIPGAKVTNHESEKQEVTVLDMRTSFESSLPPSLEREGFMYLGAASSMSEADFCSSTTIRSKYFEELRTVLHKTFPRYHAFVFFDHEIRRRSPLYPNSVGAQVTHAQPLAQPHVDYSAAGSYARLETDIPASHSHLLKLPCDLLNIWRPIHGPVRDWPLAFCSSETVNADKDPLANDILYENSIGEDVVLRFSSTHKWYYLSDQSSDEIFVWRNTNLPGGHKPRAFHTAFDISQYTRDVRARESIEVRVAAFHEDAD